MLYEIGYRPTKQKDVYDARYYWTLRQACLEAFVRTVNPWGEEFDTVMQELFEVREELTALEKCLDRIHERETLLVLTRKTPEEYAQMLHEIEQKKVKNGAD